MSYRILRFDDTDSTLRPRATAKIPSLKNKATIFKKHRCDYNECEASFDRISDLKRHRGVHVPRAQRSFVCDWPDCDYRSSQKSNVATHYRSIHLKERHPCPAENCTKTYSDPASLSRHRQYCSHNAVPSMPPKSSKLAESVTCDWSGCDYSSESNIKAHYRKVHEQEAYFCTVSSCTRAFSDTASLDQHQQKCSGFGPHPTSSKRVRVASPSIGNQAGPSTHVNIRPFRWPSLRVRQIHAASSEPSCSPTNNYCPSVSHESDTESDYTSTSAAVSPVDDEAEASKQAISRLTTWGKDNHGARYVSDQPTRSGTDKRHSISYMLDDGHHVHHTTHSANDYAPCYNEFDKEMLDIKPVCAFLSDPTSLTGERAGPSGQNHLQHNTWSSYNGGVRTLNKNSKRSSTDWKQFGSYKPDGVDHPPSPLAIVYSPSVSGESEFPEMSDIESL